MSSIAGLTLSSDYSVLIDNTRTVQPQTVYPAIIRQANGDNLYIAHRLKMLGDGKGCWEFQCDPYCLKFNDLAEAYMKNRSKIIFPASDIWPKDVQPEAIPFFPFKAIP
jgi:hypothetical protein